MSSFYCEVCGKAILDGPNGYYQGCEHYPIDEVKGAKAYKSPYKKSKIQANPRIGKMKAIKAEDRKAKEMSRVDIAQSLKRNQNKKNLKRNKYYKL